MWYGWSNNAESGVALRDGCITLVHRLREHREEGYDSLAEMAWRHGMQPEELKVGDQVAIDYASKDGKHVARSIAVEPER